MWCLTLISFVVFFFSSRRRHTRYWRDWSSDVCSSDLDRLSDIANTFINIYDQQGKLPVWHLMGNETDCMVGNPGIIVLGDLVMKGYVKDKEAAFEAMKASAMLDERGMNSLKKNGYVAYEDDPTFETVAKTMEYAIADAAIDKVAKLLGKTEDYKYFLKRSQSYHL